MGPPPKVALPPIGPDSFIDVNVKYETRVGTSKEKIGELCSQATGNCFDQVTDKEYKVTIPVARPTLDGQRINKAQLLVMTDDQRETKIADLAKRAARCRSGRPWVLLGIPLVFPGTLAAIITGALVGNGSVALIAGGATLAVGVTSIVIGSMKGGWSCGKTASMRDELDVSEHLGKDMWEYTDDVKDVQALVERFNEKHGGSARMSALEAQFPPGTTVQGLWKDGKWYPGKVGRITANGAIEVRFDDGDVDQLTPDRIRVVSAPASMQPPTMRPTPKGPPPGPPPPGGSPRPPRKKLKFK